MAVLLAVAAGAHALAESSFPAKPLRIIVPFPPGGAVDPLVRALANGMTERLAQPVVVENRPGATGTIGMNACAKSAADGYTLCFVTSDGMTVIPALGSVLPFDAEKDFEPVTLLGFAKPVLVASARSAFDSFAGLVAFARANPGKVNFGTFGEGGSSHQLLEAIQHGTGTRITNVPYKGTGPALQGALAGEVDLALSILPVVLPHIRAGRLKPLLVIARARLAALPDVPTYGDESLPLVRATWFGIVVPAGVPTDAVARLHGAIAALLADTRWRERFMPADSYEVAGDGPQEFARFLASSRADGKAIAELLRAGGYRPQ
ncbi:MAG TPA: tripartite tricarboxylate transporter substrate binding protein [Burkholderiales bacterium]|nr:tripartite tricarboxylate transporter substrate binding protein [Burkholderiales bacterium]